MVIYIAIFHSWHVSSKKWERVDVDAGSRKEAEEKADAMLGRRSGDFYKWDYYLIEINIKVN